MNLHPLDWTIVAALLALMLIGLLASRRRMQSVADFLAAGRAAGRYLLTVSSGVAGLGDITIIGLLEMNYVAGFSMSWWSLTMGVAVLAVTVSGWVTYRFRQSRCLTLAEFFERRYSRRFRVFAGLLAFSSGIVNYGIFPAVGARFFIYFCGLPPALSFGGLAVPTFPLIMAFLLGLSLTFVFAGGQVAVMVTDFLQGVFVNVAFVVLVLFLFTQVHWQQMLETLAMAPEQASLINPFQTSHVEDFNLVYFMIGIFGYFYGTMSWQGTSAYNASALNAHEAKMAGVLGNWRNFAQNLFILVVPIMAYTVMRHPDFAPVAETVRAALAGEPREAIQSQLRTPLVLTHLLPVGLMGIFTALMLAASVTTHATYLHSWGSILIQDTVMPLRRRPLSTARHLLLLRLAIFGVAVFAFVFSLLFKQSEYIFLFFAITGAIFAGGSGAVIIGGLYWKRGSAAAAWTAMLVGSTIAVGGILVHRLDPALFAASREALPALARFGWGLLAWLHGINGQQYWALAMFASTLLYIVVSLLGPRRAHDLERTLHRGAHAIAADTAVGDAAPVRGWRVLGVSREFTRGDRVIYALTYAWTGLWVLVFIVGTVWSLSRREPRPDYAAVAEPARSALVATETLLQSKDTPAAAWAPAAQRLDSLLVATPALDHPLLRQRLGLCWLKAGNPEAALPHLETAVARDPGLHRGWTSLAEAATATGRLERAQAAAARGLATLDPVSRSWARYWGIYVVVQIVVTVLSILWLTTGGLRDIRRLFRRLDSSARDALDDGRVRDPNQGS